MRQVCAKHIFHATILTKRLENAKYSSMVGAVAMQTTSKLLLDARKLVRNCRHASFQRNPVSAGDTSHATILTKRLENADSSFMAVAVAMQTTSKLRENALRNVSTRKTGKDRL